MLIRKRGFYLLAHLPTPRGSRGLVEPDLGHELGETRVGAQRVGHGVDVQVDEAVDFFLEGEVQQSEAFVFFPQSKVDGRRVQIRDEPGSRLLLQLLEGRSRCGGMSCRRMGMTVSHKYGGFIARGLTRV